MQVTPVTPVIGAEVSGVDLREPLDDDQRDEIRAALLEHLVLFFRDQPVTQEEQLAFAAQFGEPRRSLAAKSDGIESWFDTLEDTADSPPKADFWHTDVAFLPEPPDIAVLAMLATPPVGGDTMWSSLYAAHDGLSPTMQELLAPLELDLDLGAPFKASVTSLSGRDQYEHLAQQYPSAHHPLVRVHPETGRRALFLCGAYMRGIVGMHEAEGAALIAFLRTRLDDPNVQCRWRWRLHDVVMWDERCTNHRAAADHYPSYRKITRCLVGGTAPIPVGSVT